NEKVEGIGIAKNTTRDVFDPKSVPEENSEQARTAATMLNEFTEQVVQLLRDHPVNRARSAAGKKPMNCILARDSGNRYPKVDPIHKKHGISVGCIVYMQVQTGI